VRSWLRLAPAIGREFSYALLRAFPMSSDELAAALSARRFELVFERGTPPDAVYRFKHALVETRRTVACCAAAGSTDAQIPKRSKANPRADGASLNSLRTLYRGRICRNICFYWGGPAEVGGPVTRRKLRELQKGLDQLSLLPSNASA